MAERAARFSRRPPPPAADAAEVAVLRAAPPVPPAPPFPPAVVVESIHEVALAAPEVAAVAVVAEVPDVVAPPPRPTREPDDPRLNRPKPLDMAEIALRNRLARDAARRERLVEEEPPPPTETPAQRPQLSMAERAARNSMAHRLDRDDTPAQGLPAVAAAAASEVAAPAAEPDGPSMADRAADAVRRRRDAAGGAQVAAVAAVPDSGRSPEASYEPAVATAFFLVSRNHAAVVRDRLAAWHERLDRVDLRWWLLDLGSVDESAAEGERAQATVLHRPGGLVKPLQSIEIALRTSEADLVVLADPEATPDVRVNEALTIARRGTPLVIVGAGRTPVVVISRRAWQHRPFDGYVDLEHWAQAAGGVRRLGRVRKPLPHPGLVGQAVQAARWLRVAADAQRVGEQVWELVGTVRKLIGR